ncbi:MAG: CDP-glycerol glycerophosphotransferase family protein [bacterium]|nr:CDP-glycerol glycerophosphotransferase family protein [bacterium]
MHIYFPLYYRICAMRKVNEKSVLFIEVRLEALSNNFTLLYQYFNQENEFRIKTHYLHNGKVSEMAYLSRCKKMIKDLAASEYVFLNEGSNVVSAVPLRKETKLIQTWHGCGAFKKFGHSLDKVLEEPFYRNYSLVTVSSPEVVWAYKEAMQVTDEIVKPVGVSRTDLYFDQQFIRNAKKKVNETFHIGNKKIVLYAPTFRGEAHQAKEASVLDYKYLYDLLYKDYVIILKYHPVVQDLIEIPEEYQSFIINNDNQCTIEELLCASDICISDYSSLIFEYALLERPMIFYAYDEQDYIDQRGFYYGYEEFTPGPIVKTKEELAQAIMDAKNYDLSCVKAFKDKFMSSCDGNATKRIVQYIMQED